MILICCATGVEDQRHAAEITSKTISLTFAGRGGGELRAKISPRKFAEQAISVLYNTSCQLRRNVESFSESYRGRSMETFLQCVLKIES